MKYARPLTTLLVVLLLHGALLASAVLLESAQIPKVEPPRFDGLLIPAPPAEVVKAPPPPPEPVKPPPEPQPKPVPPKPQPKPKPVPKPKPKPLPPPETAITQPAPAPAPAPPPPVVEAKPDTSLSAPVTPPHVDATRLRNPLPVYPSISRRRREEGTVLLDLLVLANGSVSEVRIHTSSGFPRLDKAALEAVKRWRYTPAKRAGIAIEYRYQQPVTFNLH